MKSCGLFQYSGTHCGCGAKLAPWDLQDLISGVNFTTNSDVVLSAQDLDDVGAYQVTKEKILVQNVDVITPVVDDAYLFGRIAINHALSDIYAKGCNPLFAMNILGVPSHPSAKILARDILLGASDACQDLEVSLLGGHTFEDNELKFGISVVGVPKARGIIRSSTAQLGDKLILTKPIGIGILTTAKKIAPEKVGEEEYNTAIDTMTISNQIASYVMDSFPVNACTDVTGFGLLGHLIGLLESSGCSAELVFENIPILAGAERLVNEGIMSPLLHKNQDFFELKKNAVSYTLQTRLQLRSQVLYDPQTSGGLIICIQKDIANDILTELRQSGYPRAIIIGELTEMTDRPRVHIR